MPRFSDIVVRSSTVAAFIVSAMSAANAGIDLTPSPSEYVAEGMKHQQLTFVQDKQRIEYELPAGMAAAPKSPASPAAAIASAGAITNKADQPPIPLRQ